MAKPIQFAERRDIQQKVCKKYLRQKGQHYKLVYSNYLFNSRLIPLGDWLQSHSEFFHLFHFYYPFSIYFPIRQQQLKHNVYIYTCICKFYQSNIFVLINIILLIEPLIQGEDYAALGMNFEHVSYTLHYIICTITFITLLL